MDSLNNEIEKFKTVIVSKDEKVTFKSKWDQFSKTIRTFIVANRKFQFFYLILIDTPVARKAIFFGIALLALKQFTGNTTMLNYAGQIFQDSGSDLDKNLSAIIIGIVQLLGTFTPTLLVDRAGRKVI